MAVGLPSSFVVRKDRLGIVVAIGFAVLLGSGCAHRRAAMRPVYVTPAPVAVPAAVTPEPALVPAPAPAPAVEPAPTIIRRNETTIVPAPSLAPSGGSVSPPAPTEIAPPAKSVGSGNGSTPSEAPAGEPSLDLNKLPPPDALPQAPSAGPTSRRNSLEAAPVRSASLRSNVTTFVNDPDDLFEPPKADRRWCYIVVHHSASATGSYASIDKLHKERLGTDGCGYHFVIGNGSESPDGQIEVTRRWAEQKGGAHCRDAVSPDVNDYGIGICLVGNFDEKGPTPRQLAATKALVAYLSDRYAIATDHVGVHARFASKPTDCPGKIFALQTVLSMSTSGLH